MTVTDIILTAPDTYAATINGEAWVGITPASRFYVMVQDAIAAGAEVTVQPI